MSILSGEQMKMSQDEARACVGRLYERVAGRWKERIADAPFMQQSRFGSIPPKVLRLFFKNWNSFTIKINSLEAASQSQAHSLF
jgi:hypothetical protein